jgi:hypothetical protein
MNKIWQLSLIKAIPVCCSSLYLYKLNLGELLLTAYSLAVYKCI